jgi:DNA invertase Pin-like site-specific DNA recombinase
MALEVQQKITANHLARFAYLYVRQSTLRQVFENPESTKRQYALREKANSLGWPSESIIVIDSDLGQSGAQAADREGFQRLVADVSLGRAGVVMGLEVSRLARNSSDWHRLLEICALTDCLILDEDGIYNPAHFNDRLLLGLKGTMSEAELHVLKARLFGGLLNKAKRGQLKFDLPVGFVHSEKGEVKLDPNLQIQQSIKLFFDTFCRTGSAFAACREFDKQKLLFPRKIRKGPDRGEIIWGKLGHARALQLLHNPRYAGVYCYGKTRTRKLPGGDYSYSKVPRSDWIAFIPEAHPGYISLTQYEENQDRLRRTSQALGHDRRKSPPREGPALLQGLISCGKCGDRMTVRYRSRRSRQSPIYICQRRSIDNCESKPCQSMSGDAIDKCISDLLVETVSPLALQVALSVQDELQSRFRDADEIRKKQVERLRYEVELSRRRYLRVDPDNRLVAASLEAEWNQNLRALTEAQEDYEKQSKIDEQKISQQQREQILALSTDFPKLWNAPNMPDRERKRIIRLIIEDVTLHNNGEQRTIQVRFKGGATQSLSLGRSPNGGQLRTTASEVVKEVDRLLDNHSYAEIADILNQKGLRSGDGHSFTWALVERIRFGYSLTSRYDRLRNKGFLTTDEVAHLLGVTKLRVYELRDDGYLSASPTNHKKAILFKPPTKTTLKAISRMAPKPIGRPSNKK